MQSTVFPNSVSVTDLSKAGKVFKPPATNTVSVHLEILDVREIKWNKVVHWNLKLKKLDLPTEHLEMHFGLQPLMKKLHKLNGW